MKFISTKMFKRSCLYRATVLIAFSGTLTTYAQDRKIDRRVDSLMKLMTLEEKVGQLNQYSGREVTGPVSEKKTDVLQDIRTGRVGSMLNVRGVKDTREIQKVALESRLKIPLLFSLDVIHGYKTVFPIPLGEAASWDLNAMRLSAQIAAKEAAAAGIHWTFAPMVDVARDPRWGRVMEGAGEDAYLGSLIAEARVKGFQGEQLGSVESIMACAKHFAGYGASIAGRDYNAVDMSRQQLWETYLPPFKASVDAGVATFMNAFNTLNGVPATGNAYLQRDILKSKWNFKGFMVSDWGSIGEMIPWGYAANEADAAVKAITAGSDMDMESRAYIDNLAQLVKEGKVSLKWVDDAVRRILYKKFELGLFEDPYRFSNFKREKKVFSDPAHRVAARELAKKSIVLLKNDQNILPIKNDVRNIALIGPLVQAKRDLEGSWIVESDSVNVVSLIEGVRNQISGKTNLIYAKGAGVLSSSEDSFAAAVEAARKADVVIMALGETWDMSGEAKSRADIRIPGKQEALFEAVKATGKPVIVVLMAGRPLIFDKIAAEASAILYAWWPGTEGGNAIADVLFGAYNPSAKLPVTFPRSVGQIPLSYDVYNTGRPVKDPANTRYKSMYIDSPNTPMYAFGYGLSYTSFGYSDLKLDSTSINQNGEAVLSFRLTNTGKVTGEEVVQLYIHDEVASVARPLKQLKGFQKLALKPGESRELKFTIKSELLSFYDNDLNWIAEPGRFKLMVGSASDDIRLQTNLTLR
ncbi:beta-glucosidase BglX [Arcticibacter sp.]|uniref:beta-glucosidase BglX n=1 Tax=Arcticibacter sp. TaxID=1872630 RepID=UPI003891178E